MADIFELFKRIRKTEDPKGPPEYIIVGLGNPGDKYEGTRHNAGFSAIDFIADRLSVRIKDLKFKSLVARCSIDGTPVLLLKPQTFMNLSGQAVKEACDFYKIPPERLIVISDDVNLDAGRLRIRGKGSDGGHNGLYNIIYLLSSDGFPRIRIGVGKKPREDYDLADWVLSRMDGTDGAAVAATFPDVFEAVRMIVGGKMEAAMGMFNGKKKTDDDVEENRS